MCSGLRTSGLGPEMVVISGPHYLRRTHPIETKEDCIPRPEWLFISNLCSFPLSANMTESLIHKSSGGDIRRMSQVLVPSDPSHHEAASGQLHPG